MTGTGLAAQLLDRIRTHFLALPRAVNAAQMTEEDALTGAVMLTEVAAPRSGRRADAIVIGLARSRAGIDGIEVKVSRSDWLRELEQPTKADGWFAHTHRWWVAVPSETLVRPEELPPGWGLMVPSPRSSKRMTTVVKPADREAEITWPVLCEIAKKMDRQRAGDVAAEVSRLSTAVHKQARAAAEAQYAHRRSDEESIGKALLDITGQEPFQLRYLAEYLSAPQQDAVRALFAAATNDGDTDHTVLTGILQRQFNQHQQALEQYGAALAAVTAANTPANTAASSDATPAATADNPTR